MSLLIDGYNLLNAVGILGRGVGPGSLERSRLALLNFLAESLAAEEVAAHDGGLRRPRRPAGPAADDEPSRPDGPLRRAL